MIPAPLVDREAMSNSRTPTSVLVLGAGMVGTCTALHLAQRGYGSTSPNPMVGAVIVRRGEVIGEGWHKRAGEPHAEVNAIAAARRAGKELRGATIYVTLEPCSTTGRTPPCTSALIESGISRVVVAESRNFKGFQDVLSLAGVQVADADDQRCVHMMGEFIAAHPELWNEDIGE